MLAFVRLSVRQSYSSDSFLCFFVGSEVQSEDPGRDSLVGTRGSIDPNTVFIFAVHKFVAAQRLYFLHEENTGVVILGYPFNIL